MLLTKSKGYWKNVTKLTHKVADIKTLCIIASETPSVEFIADHSITGDLYHSCIIHLVDLGNSHFPFTNFPFSLK